MKKRIGRPKKAKLLLPAWAEARAIEIGERSGVMSQRTLENALKVGLHAVSEQYAPLIEFQASADTLFAGEQTEPDIKAPEELPEPEAFDRIEAEDSGEADRDPEPVAEEPGENGSFALIE